MLMARTLHTDDVVVEGDDTQIGVVERTHGDVDSHHPFPARSSSDSLVRDQSITKKLFDKFLKDGIPPPGSVLVQWYHIPSSSLISESKLKLIDRSLLIGDVVKRNSRDAMSGVVINTSTKCTLRPCGDIEIASNQKKLKGLLTGDGEHHGIRPVGEETQLPLFDIPSSELRYDETVNEEDLIIWKDRIGRIDELNLTITVRLSDNSVVEIHDDLAEHVDGAMDLFAIGDIAVARKGALRLGKWIYGQYNPNTPPIGTVVARRIINAEVTWLQRRIGAPETDDPVSTLDRDEIEADDFYVYDRTKRPKDLRNASTTLSYSEIDVRLGLRVRFKDLSGACVKYDGSTPHGKLQRIDRNDTLGYDLNVFDVVRFRTEVTVQWQDLSVTQESSVDLVPDSSIDDENAAWPGEIAHTLEFEPAPGQQGMTQPSKVGVVQDVNSLDRMATMRWCPGAHMQYFEDLDESPGVKTLILAVVGQAGDEKQELSLYDLEAPGMLNVRRGDIVLLIKESGDQHRSSILRSEPDWVGEVVDTCLDGNITIRLGAMEEVRDIKVPREQIRVAVRSDGTDQMDHWDDDVTWDEEMSSSEEENDMSDDYFSEDEEEIRATYEDENGMPLEEEDVENDDWESDGDASQQDIDMVDVTAATPPTSNSVTPPETGKQQREESVISLDQISSVEPEQYLVLEGMVPVSHHYCNEPSTQSSPHMKRLQKEHKILRTSNALPNGVYVRTWESRLDLLRVLFIGPTETPYSHVPFIIDFYISSSFPAEPPKAFFHSWIVAGAGGVGRVNPNLYEDGKICLSLLGTWDGDKGEGWSAARSTLLQVLVSILGLVLVREPYFNEAGYEPLAGLESSRRPSALYNERTFLRASVFVIKAVNWLNSADGTTGTDIEGLEDVVRWLYKDPLGRRLLEKKTREVEDVLGRSEVGGLEPDGMTVMSKGACIPMKRMLTRLMEL
jgi:ubiquitin-conjugating enzyme E2 O